MSKQTANLMVRMLQGVVDGGVVVKTQTPLWEQGSFAI